MIMVGKGEQAGCKSAPCLLHVIISISMLAVRFESICYNMIAIFLVSSRKYGREIHLQVSRPYLAAIMCATFSYLDISIFLSIHYSVLLVYSSAPPTG